MLNYSYDIKVDSAYIIKIDGNQNSESLATRCADSCLQVGMPYKFFSAVDGTQSDLIFPKDVHPIVNLLKITNTSLTKSEIACMISHFLLWVKCVELDKPIVILEHDSVMVAPYLEHPFFSVISYLGSSEQVIGGWKTFFPMPPHGQLNPNYRFILRAHAYAIDPTIARVMVAKVIKHGIQTSADVFMRIDEFAIIQQGIYAFNLDGETTITDRQTRDNNPEWDSNHNKLVVQ